MKPKTESPPAANPPALPESHSPKAARILASATELLLNRGFKGLTIADVAHKAYVGKGTVYLYWPTKEDLLIGLIGRDFLSTTDELIARLVADPDVARPSRFCPVMVSTARSRPLMTALHDHNDDVLGLLTTHPRAAALDAAIGPRATMRVALPSWRAHGMVRTDWDPEEQAMALTALTGGIMMSLVRPALSEGVDTLRVFAAAVTALLGENEVGEDQVRAAAADLIDFFRQGRSAIIETISSADT
ncbi:TetR/AcrR family transcriptional regulator [Mycolicibacterium sp. CH28]|uniref:TetR/AcrR family transcriptional regulator n=1 Tax=Mycolicibacterium sp. CH28 TaxID=2512237 RepID=UPI0010802058|nr:TetR/AcrR family transcriptional regulator [Mycolicibacterium sp. CH28]TGD85599.1 TetR/AcrR family transcriptional regulator [Mycolicibacterium sp. CH28]